MEASPVVRDHFDVGYSFANQGVPDRTDNELKVENVPEVQSELPSFNQKVDESEDDFRQKYVNVDARTMLKATDIQEIESVQYVRPKEEPPKIQEPLECKPIEVEEPSLQNKPNSSMETKLISSEEHSSPPHESETATEIKTSIIIEEPKEEPVEQYSQPQPPQSPEAKEIMEKPAVREEPRVINTSNLRGQERTGVQKITLVSPNHHRIVEEKKVEEATAKPVEAEKKVEYCSPALNFATSLPKIKEEPLREEVEAKASPLRTVQQVKEAITKPEEMNGYQERSTLNFALPTTNYTSHYSHRTTETHATAYEYKPRPVIEVTLPPPSPPPTQTPPQPVSLLPESNGESNRRSLLRELDIKESINVEEGRASNRPDFKRTFEQTKRQSPMQLDKLTGASLKQSVEGSEDDFGFNF